MNRNKLKIGLGILIMVAIISPYFPPFVLFQVFFLPIPLGCLLLGAGTYMILSWANKDGLNKKALLVILVVPLFTICNCCLHLQWIEFRDIEV